MMTNTTATIHRKPNSTAWSLEQQRIGMTITFALHLTFEFWKCDEQLMKN